MKEKRFWIKLSAWNRAIQNCVISVFSADQCAFFFRIQGKFEEDKKMDIEHALRFEL